MLFHANALLLNRHGDPFREAKPNEKPRADGSGFEPSQMRDLRHGDVVVLALDSALEGDDKAMKDDPAKWVKSVMKREAISAAVAAAMKNGDGWVTLKEEQDDLIIERLALLVPRTGVGMVGQVMAALRNPPEEKPGEVKPKANGKAAAAHP